MHEIEIKAAVRNPELTLAKLTELGCSFSEAVSQDDTVYVKNPGATIEEFTANSMFLRTRVQDDGKILFTLKHHEGRNANDPKGVPLEYELEVSSRETMAAILGLLDFKEAVRVKKSRRTAHYENWELCLDEVEGLGTFLEVECFGTFEDAEAIQQEMIAFLHSLGIAAEDIPAQRYDIAILKKTIV